MVRPSSSGCELLIHAIRNAGFVLKDDAVENSHFTSVPAGIRLESNVLITKTGIRTLTNVPRDIDDVERVLAGGEWPVPSATVGKA